MGLVRLLGEGSYWSTCYASKKAGVGMLGRQAAKAISGVYADPIVVFPHSKSGRCMSMGCIGELCGAGQHDL